MDLQRVMTDEVNIPPRLRAVDEAKVKQLAESMGAIGLQTPITLFHAGPDADGFDLVTGAHRLQAAKSLGWEWIDAFFMKGNEIDRQLWEIDENLMRAELDAVQKSEHLAKRKELWGVRQNQVARVEPPEAGYKKPPPQEKGFAAATSGATGLSKASINKAVARAEQICQEARDLIRDTKLNNGTFLDKLKNVPLGDQVDFARSYLERLERPASKPKLAPDPDNDLIVKERQVAALMAAWNKAGREAREEFLSRVENPVMDERYG